MVYCLTYNLRVPQFIPDTANEVFSSTKSAKILFQSLILLPVSPNSYINRCNKYFHKCQLVKTSFLLLEHEN